MASSAYVNQRPRTSQSSDQRLHREVIQSQVFIRNIVKLFYNNYSTIHYLLFGMGVNSLLLLRVPMDTSSGFNTCVPPVK